MNPDVWNQLKNIPVEKLIAALTKDKWEKRSGRGSRYVFVKEWRLVSIHYHPGKTFGPKLLQDLMDDIGWTEQDFQRLKLIK